MAKRFIDDKIWSKPWFQELDPIYKLLYIYLFSVCDIAGIWEFNEKRAEFDLNKKIQWDKAESVFSDKIIFTAKYWIIKSFIKQQYPNLNKKPKAPLHISVSNHIDKMCLNFDLNSLSVDYDNPIDSLQVKVKAKVEVKEEVKAKEIESREKEFNNSVLGFSQYDIELLNAFIRHWTEKNKSGKKMRFEDQPTFEISKRLVTWKKNDEKWSSKKTPINNRTKKSENEFQEELEIPIIEMGDL